MAIVFAWDEWNKERIKKHGGNQKLAEFIVRRASSPFPREVGDDKYLVWVRGEGGDFFQVVFAFKAPEDLEFTSLEFLDWSTMMDYAGTVAIYVIHAMPLTPDQLRQYRKLGVKHEKKLL